MSLSAQQNLMQARENIAAQIRDITSNPKPTYSFNGKSLSWGEHFNNLIAAQDKVERLILQQDGAFEVQNIYPQYPGLS